MAGVAAKVVFGLLRFGIGGLFAFAGATKIWDWGTRNWATQQFAYDVQSYQLTSWTASILIAVYLPWLELFSGIAVMVRKLYQGALAALFALLCLFIAALVSAWARNLDITCGCFRPLENRTNYPMHIGSDLAMLIGLSLLINRERRTTAST
jgi:putative oxidoreductase